jgi:hypothetical protein|tara:strand:+ start:295 stop:414 length:120 start_codon:yes stop_codon:yes gene_type:complete
LDDSELDLGTDVKFSGAVGDVWMGWFVAAKICEQRAMGD